MYGAAQENYCLTVVPQGGLGNRMRVVRSAMEVAKLTECAVRVAWTNCKECRCDFGDVFMPVITKTLNLPDNFIIRPARGIDYPVSRVNLHIPALLRKGKYGAEYKNFNALQSEDIFEILKQNKRVYLSTCYEFCESNMPLSEIFHPSPKVREGVEKCVENFAASTIGLHIRTTDNVAAIEASPVSLFLKVAEQELERNPQIKIFLAADSNEVKALFQKRFGASVVTAEGEMSRSSKNGMINAATDLYTLARTAKISEVIILRFPKLRRSLGTFRSRLSTKTTRSDFRLAVLF